MAVHFTLEEFSNRKSKVIRELKKQNLDGLLMFRQESMYWLTGYDTFGYVYFQCLVLTTKGDLVLLTKNRHLASYRLFLSWYKGKTKNILAIHLFSCRNRTPI